MFKKVIASLLVAAGLSTTAFAVTAEEQQERLMTVYSHLLDFRPNNPATGEARGTIEVEAEILHMPNVDNRVGIKEEPIQGMPLVPRFRVRVWPTNYFYLGAGGNPPVPFEGYSYGFLAGEAGATYRPTQQVGITGRAYVADSSVTGPVTEEDADDKFNAQQRGADVSVGVDIHTVTLSAGAGVGQLDSELEVESDGVKLDIVDKNYKYTMAGVAWRPAMGYRMSFNQNFTDGGILQHWSLNFTKQF